MKRIVFGFSLLFSLIILAGWYGFTESNPIQPASASELQNFVPYHSTSSNYTRTPKNSKPFSNSLSSGSGSQIPFSQPNGNSARNHGGSLANPSDQTASSPVSSNLLSSREDIQGVAASNFATANNMIGQNPAPRLATGSFSSAPVREMSIPVPVGAKVPAVFYDGEEKPVPQQKAMDRIAKEFEQNVSQIPLGMTKDEVWDAARQLADERYLTLFGYQAFNQHHIQAAKDALREKKGK